MLTIHDGCLVSFSHVRCSDGRTGKVFQGDRNLELGKVWVTFSDGSGAMYEDGEVELLYPYLR